MRIKFRFAIRTAGGFSKTPLILALGLLAACATPPERDPARTAHRVPARWSNPAALAGAVRPWLRAFASPELDGLVGTALVGNFDLKAVAARVAQARAQVRIAGAERLPQVELAPGFQHLGLVGNGEVAGNFWELPFNLSWELDLWGRIRSTRQAAESEALAAGSDLEGAALSLGARTVQACFELAETRQQVGVVEQSIAERQAVVELVRGRFQLGLGSGLDLSLAATDLNDAEAQLAEARDRQQAAARRLETLLGRYPAAALRHCADLPELPAALPVGLPAELLARRPDLKAAFARLRALDSRLDSAEKALLPRVALTAAGGTFGTALGELVDPRAIGWNLAMGLAQPLFTGGRLSAEIDLAGAQVEEALQLYREAALNAFREVEQALAAERWLSEREHALTATLARTETSRKLAIDAYRNGTVEILPLLDSYRSTLNARSALLSARRQLLQNRVGLYLALGGAA
ncbi:efflux transporter, outer membrane factor (OMF) lipoprotein, NodT family [Methylomagnum ishizawai]|uniref:Efflux transporter, outer membrane factor (OMF) lipoprotein, NodT family n=1 Tax=Methylomagnum ishizawai TaxID=1760988 RepID=A0A1Y6D4E1_9GAMM|nr:efflux transporter outer membrane subunit [Methylomagnum ishizawai]SMF97466.1 efflux transporter, outer membrane factor (OMF) lipoprotein, NodT family [Methylomagnum ishizawai]